MTRHRNAGLRKICGCARTKWPKCPHIWHVNFCPPGGPSFRFSLDRHLGRHVDAKSEAVGEFDKIRAAIREGRFQLGSPSSAESITALTLATLVSDYQRDYLDIRLPTAKAEANRLALALATLIPRPGGAVPFGTLPVSEITPRDIDALVAAKKGAKRKHCRCSDRLTCAHPWRESGANGDVAINRILARLRACLNWALKRQIITKTPFRVDSVASVSLLPEASRFRRLEPGEEERLLAACAPHLRAVVVAALETCCRVSELLTLQWSQVSFERNEIHLPARKTKAKRDRILPITSRLKAVLEMRRLDPAGRDLPTNAYVFGTATGECIASIKAAWRLTCVRAGITGLHFHDLRREAGSRFMESGRFFLHDVQRFLDHADITTTSRYLQASRLSLHSAMRQYEADRQVSQRVPQHGLADKPERRKDVEGDGLAVTNASVASPLQVRPC